MGSVATTLKTIATAGALGAGGAAVWGIGIERYLFTVREHDLAVLPPGSASITVLHLSDAHMAPWQRRKQRWIAELAEDVQPDLVINTGDNLGHERGLDGIRVAFAPLRSVPGFFVHGSNDEYAPSGRNPIRYFTGPSRHAKSAPKLDTDAMDDFFSADLGWADLDNAAATVRLDGIRIDGFGVNDAHRDWDDLGALPAALEALGARDEATLAVGVTHAPYRRVLDSFVDLGADVIFGGHTHGGQVRVPFSSRALVANCDIPLDQARGLSSWGPDAVPLNVSAGLGHSIYAPVRFGCRPEASVLTLRARTR
ncbi:metallophosphoesterase [Microbacterium radiodurans]|uniref:Metallophosphoesterase n=1 Tax=Microbacterium radiodurans TaxID=661398 RepID=A0A5J5IQU5_9MICO|nr:metallophosphoesterase [Microbacterium radiodurans]KAA9085265.1 metallophosphoesterase [Microbacterium radiodurans]